MSDPVLWLKCLHILSATVLFGTGIGTAFQMVMAMRGRDPATIHAVARAVVTADWVFTTPAGVIQPASGIALALATGYSLTEAWLLATYVLYALAFLCWAPVVGLQIRIRDLAGQAVATGGPLPPRAVLSYRIWFALGWPAFTALVVIFALMVFKPELL